MPRALEVREPDFGFTREQLEAEIQRAERKLCNDGFTSKAPKDVVDAERDKLTRLREELAAL